MSESESKTFPKVQTKHIQVENLYIQNIYNINNTLKINTL